MKYGSPFIKLSGNYEESINNVYKSKSKQFQLILKLMLKAHLNLSMSLLQTGQRSRAMTQKNMSGVGKPKQEYCRSNLS